MLTNVASLDMIILQVATTSHVAQVCVVSPRVHNIYRYELLVSLYQQVII